MAHDGWRVSERTKRLCRVHGFTEHGAQNKCLLCKKAQSLAWRASQKRGKAPSKKLAAAREKTIPKKTKKLCERPGCAKPATMWPSDPKWCGHAHRVWCCYRSPAAKKARAEKS